MMVCLPWLTDMVCIQIVVLIIKKKMEIKSHTYRGNKLAQESITAQKTFYIIIITYIKREDEYQQICKKCT